MTPHPSIAIAMLSLRLVAGILFFFQGYDKLFRVRTENVVGAFRDLLSQKGIPLPLARLSVTVSSAVELAGGLLLAAGLFREPALYALTANLVAVAFAFSFVKPMWDMSHFFPRLILLVALLLLPATLDPWCLGNLL